MDQIFVGFKDPRGLKCFLTDGTGVDDLGWIPLVRVRVGLEDVGTVETLLANGTERSRRRPLR